MTKHIKTVMNVSMRSTPEHFFLHSRRRIIHKPCVQTGTTKTCWRCCRYLYQKGKEYVSTSSDPTPLLKQHHLNAVAQDNVVAFEYLQVWRLHNFPGQSLPVLSHPHRKKCFLVLRRNFLCFTFCPLSLVLLQSTAESSQMLSSSFPLSSSMCWLFTLPSALNSTTSSWLLQPWLRLTFTSPASHSLWAWSPAQHLFSLTLLSLRRGIYQQCTPGTTWIV